MLEAILVSCDTAYVHETVTGAVALCALACGTKMCRGLRMFKIGVTCTVCESVVHFTERSDTAAVYESAYPSELSYNYWPYVSSDVHRFNNRVSL